ncbi:MAG: PDZ domain-containing protein [Pirellulales bacterium]|nr:PDZ domain-containing protein [Pirellulales bacterium]
MSELIDKFVFVRLIKVNRLDLSLFQFDYDLTFAVFFMNADKTIYGRYGTRSSVEDAEKHMTTEGLAKSKQAALILHENYPDNKVFLAGKQPIETRFQTPNDIPSLRGKYKADLDVDGKIVQSCLHCHQIMDAKREIYRSAGKAMPDKLVFPLPLPRVIGLTLDPKTRATVSRVAAGSAAYAAGIRTGDELITLDSQAIVSIADVQWVLDNAPSDGELRAMVKRDDAFVPMSITLEQDWRRQTDISWRVTTWPLRRMGTGGLVFEPVSDGQRNAAGLSDELLALRVKYVGQYGLHAAAKRAGFRKGDIVISFAGQKDNWTTSQLLAYIAQRTKPGMTIPVTIVRNGQQIQLKLPMQK